MVVRVVDFSSKAAVMQAVLETAGSLVQRSRLSLAVLVLLLVLVASKDSSSPVAWGARALCSVRGVVVAESRFHQTLLQA